MHVCMPHPGRCSVGSVLDIHGTEVNSTCHRGVRLCAVSMCSVRVTEVIIIGDYVQSEIRADVRCLCAGSMSRRCSVSMCRVNVTEVFGVYLQGRCHGGVRCLCAGSMSRRCSESMCRVDVTEVFGVCVLDACLGGVRYLCAGSMLRRCSVYVCWMRVSEVFGVCVQDANLSIMVVSESLVVKTSTNSSTITRRTRHSSFQLAT